MIKLSYLFLVVSVFSGNAFSFLAEGAVEPMPVFSDIVQRIDANGRTRIKGTRKKRR